MKNSYQHEVDHLRDCIIRSQLSVSDKARLKGILETWFNHMNELKQFIKESEKIAIDSIDFYLNQPQNLPFHWNHQRPDFKQDRKQFWDLLVYCVKYDTNHFIDRWVIDHLFVQRRCRLARDLQTYVEDFERLRNNPDIFQQEGVSFQHISPHLNYLIERLMAISQRIQNKR